MSSQKDGASVSPSVSLYSLSVNDLNILLRGGIVQIGNYQLYLDQQAKSTLQQKTQNTY